MTFGREDFPIYCTHCACTAISAIDAGSAPPMYLEASPKPGEIPCKFYIYKNPQDFPEALYAQVGRTKLP
jgi:hypothetical protein